MRTVFIISEFDFDDYDENSIAISMCKHYEAVKVLRWFSNISLTFNSCPDWFSNIFSFVQVGSQKIIFTLFVQVGPQN